MSTFLERISIGDDEKKLVKFAKANRVAKNNSSNQLFKLTEQINTIKENIEGNKNSLNFNLMEGAELSIQLSEAEAVLASSKLLFDEMFPAEDTVEA